MELKDIINNIAAGDSAAAKEGIENVLSAKAFDALQGRKQEIASTLFGGKEQSDEEGADSEETVEQE
jgi:hydroxyethylthiazole kinase-like sugar kinase family protein